LAIHPQHGPWFALRAVASIDVACPPLPTEVERPCAGCSAPCVPALQRALSASGAPLDSSAVSRHAREWIAVRDACPVGRASRYGLAQLAFHYAPRGQGIVRADPSP
jgi:methylmalonic aciduria homocystinuria type C protein